MKLGQSEVFFRGMIEVEVQTPQIWIICESWMIYRHQAPHVTLEINTRSERKVDALPHIWENMDLYIRSNHVKAWIPQTSQYFNRTMRTEHESWQEEIA